MEEIKLKAVDFAKEVGCSQKTVYNMIEKGELITVNEIQKGRKITFVISNNKQISELKKIYDSVNYNELQYYDNETFNESECNSVNYNEVTKPDTISDFANKIIEITENFNEKYLKVNEELLNYKSKVPLLEDKANREGLYLQEIKDLKLSKKKVIVWLITVIVLFAVSAVILGFLLVIEHNKPPKVITTEKVVEKIVEKPVYRYIKK